MGATAAIVGEFFLGDAAAAAVTDAVVGSTIGAAVDATLPTMLVTAGSGAAAAGAGLTAAEMASLGLTGLSAVNSFGGMGDPGYPGNGMPYDANGLPYDTSSLEFPMPIDDSTIARMTQQQGAQLGLQDAGFTWKDGVGWARNALGLANAAAGLYGTVQNGKYKVSANNAAANSSRLSAEDAARRAKQIEDYGMGEAKTMQPWDENGGRALAGAQLKELMQNPMGVASTDPAYKFRQQAAARAMGMYGQDSGAMGIAAADASSTWYDQRLQQLAGLAGANAAPGAGGALGLSTLNSAANIAGMGQASGAFGQQAAIGAQQAGTQANINTVGAVGNVINAVGNMTGVPATAVTPGSGPVPASGMPLAIGSTGVPTPTPVQDYSGYTPSPVTTASNPAGFDQIYPSNYVPPATNAPADVIKPMPVPMEQMGSSPRDMGDFADVGPYPGGPVEPAPAPAAPQTNGFYGATPVMYRTPDNPTAQMSNLGMNIPEGQGAGFAAANPAGFDQIYPPTGAVGDSAIAEDYGYPGVNPALGGALPLDYMRARARTQMSSVGAARPEMGNPGSLIPAYQQATGAIAGGATQPQAQLSAIGGVPTLGGFLPNSSQLQTPDLFSGQMGDLLGNYLSPPGTGHGFQKVGV